MIGARWGGGRPVPAWWRGCCPDCGAGLLFMVARASYLCLGWDHQPYIVDHDELLAAMTWPG